SISIAQGLRCNEVRAHRGKSVERLCPQPLTVRKLQIARRDIIDDGVTGDILEGCLDRDLAGPPPHDHSQLSFEIDLLAHLGQDDGLVRPGDSIGIHSKQQRLLWDLSFSFFDVISVVEADTDKFLRMRDGCMKSNVGSIEEKCLNTTR